MGMSSAFAYLATLLILSSPAIALNTADSRPAPPRAGVAAVSHSLPRFHAVPIAQLHLPHVRAASNTAMFRGGVRKKISALPRAAASPQTAPPQAVPRIPVVYSSLNKPGLASDGTSTPPDSTGAIGPSHYVEMVNSEIAVWRRSDLSIVSMSSFSNFIGTSDPWCDPQIQWDPSSSRWLVVILLCNTSSTLQGFITGWSKTSDPSDLVNGWCLIGVPLSPFLFDYPKLGHNSNFLIFGGNVYNESTAPNPNPPFETAAMLWIRKPANGVITCPTTTVPVGGTTADPLKNRDGVTNAFTPVPVNTMTTAANGYVVSAYDSSGSNGQGPTTRNKVGVWHLDSSGVLHQDSDVTVASYNPPAPAPQLGGPVPVDTLDGRLTQAVGDPTTGIWTQHTVAGPGPRSVVDWYELKASGSADTLAQQGVIASATDFIFNAAISPRFDAQGAAIFYSRSSSTIDPLIGGQERLSGTPAGTMEPGELVLTSSTAADADFSCGGGFPCRWGDYSGATPDPVQTNVVWGTNMVITAATAAPAWADQNFAVLFVGTPTNVTATAFEQGAVVSWTPSTFDPALISYTIKVYSGVTLVKSLVIPAPASNTVVSGLTDGVTYTFTVTANSNGGSGAESVHSNAVTPSRAVAPAPAPPPAGSRQGVPPAPPAAPGPR
jgi:Fibronectin type III domain